MPDLITKTARSPEPTPSSRPALEPLADPEQLLLMVRCLTAILAVPAGSAQAGLECVVEGMAAALAEIPDTEFAFVWLQPESGAAPLRAARAASGETPDQPERIGEALAPWLAPPPTDRLVCVANPLADGVVQVLFETLGPGPGRLGAVALGSRGPERVTAMQRLLVKIAANHLEVAIARHQSVRPQQLRDRLPSAAPPTAQPAEHLSPSIEAQRVTATAQLTGVIAHDFNNLLTAISGSLELLERHVTASTGRRLLASASRAVDRCAALTDKLLALARAQDPPPQHIDGNPLPSSRYEPRSDGARPRDRGNAEF